MTEDEVKAFEKSLDEMPLDPEFEKEWIRVTLENHRIEEKNLAAAWRMWRYVRNDEKMKVCQEGIKKIRDCIMYLEKLKKDKSTNGKGIQ